MSEVVFFTRQGKKNPLPMRDRQGMSDSNKASLLLQIRVEETFYLVERNLLQVVI